MSLLKTLGITGSKSQNKVPLYFFNTLTNKKEEFKPLRDSEVRMYNCGPTVYDVQHIGNMRPYVFADVLRRTLEYNGHKVKQVINITDVGHLTSDADEGEDKMEKAAAKEGKKAKDIAKEVMKTFLKDIEKLNISVQQILFPKATEHIEEQIVFIKTLEEKGYTYRTTDGVYFNTSLFKNYGKLGNIDLAGLKEGARVEENPEKKNPTDFALWKFSPPKGKRQQEWDSPWGIGFPGWHIECSAMSIKYLGKQFDIHTGGIDHIPIHHNNEIAQSEAVTGKQFVRYWLHNAFITVEGQKIAKSLGNTIYLRNIEDRGISALSYRYWLLTGHYKTPMNFTWETLAGAHTALFKLHRIFVEELGPDNGKIDTTYQQKFHHIINNDLDTPKAVALMWNLVKDDEVSQKNKRATLLDFDRVLGLGLSDTNKRILNLLAGKEKRLSLSDVPQKVQTLVAEREEARNADDWRKADELREKIKTLGYTIEDTDGISELRKNT